MADHALGILIVGLAVILLIALMAHHERHTDRSMLPGALQGDDTRMPFAEWDDFVQAHTDRDEVYDVEEWGL